MSCGYISALGEYVVGMLPLDTKQIEDIFIAFTHSGFSQRPAKVLRPEEQCMQFIFALIFLNLLTPCGSRQYARQRKLVDDFFIP